MISAVLNSSSLLTILTSRPISSTFSCVTNGSCAITFMPIPRHFFATSFPICPSPTTPTVISHIDVVYWLFTYSFLHTPCFTAACARAIFLVSANISPTAKSEVASAFLMQWMTGMFLFVAAAMSTCSIPPLHVPISFRFFPASIRSSGIGQK